MKSEAHPVRVLIKALCLFVFINIVYALIDPQVSSVSAYNLVFPGRTRLPFVGGGGAFSVAVDDLDTMFASHAISAPKGKDEYRVALLGDSSIWGEDLAAYEVISEQWNELNIPCRDKKIKAYNLGYPHPSIIKDLVILEKATEYDPDLIVWFVTLNTLYSQRINPFLTANRARAAMIVNTYDISFRQSELLTQNEPGFFDRTLIGQRSNLARQIKLQMLGIIWTAAGQDTNTLAENHPPNFSVSEDPRYRGLLPSEEIKDLLLWDAISAGHEIADPVPVLMVNEPIFISRNASDMVRYNAIYPRWAYDRFRVLLADHAKESGWNYLDLWDALPLQYFSDAGLHRSVQGERLLIHHLNPAVQSIGCNRQP